MGSSDSMDSVEELGDREVDSAGLFGTYLNQRAMLYDGLLQSLRDGRRSCPFAPRMWEKFKAG